MPIRTILLAAVLSCTCSALANEAQQVFDSLYGPRIKAVKASVDRADDHALAKELLTSAGSSTDTPALLVLFCEASYELSSKHADGFATAAQAMTLLSENVEAQRAAAREKLVEVLTKQSRLGKPEERDAASEQIIDTLLTMGDEKFEQKKWTDATSDYRRAVAIATPKKSAKLETIKAKLELTTRRDRSEKQIARLNEKLLGDANDWASAEEIVKLYVVEFDDPKSALPFLNRVKDEKLKKLVPLAAGEREPKNDDVLALGEWFRSLAGNAPDSSRIAVLRHAAAHLRHFTTSADGSLDAKKAALLLADVERHLTRLADAQPAALTQRPNESKQWINILPTIDVSKDRRWGNWRSEKEGLVLKTQDGWNVLNTPIQLEGGYDIRCRFTRDSGADAVMFQIPIKGRSVELVLSGSAGTFHSLHRSTVEAKRQADIVKPGTIVNGQVYLLEVFVRQTAEKASVQFSLDGKTIVEWTETLDDITAANFVKTASPSTINIATYGADLTIRQLDVRVAGGKMSVSRSGGK